MYDDDDDDEDEPYSLYVCVCILEIRMQPMPPQNQTVVANPMVVQPTYVSRPYVTASVVETYRAHQSAVIGILLIIAGSLSIIFNIVDLIIGSERHYVSYYAYYHRSLSDFSNGVSGHGIWCGILVGISSVISVNGNGNDN